MKQSVIIVGGGMAGSILALTLSSLTQGKLSIELVEAYHPGSLSHPGFDARAIALAQGTCQQLAKTGIWSELQQYATPITNIHVSDRGHASFTQLAAKDYQLSALGQVIELQAAGEALFRLLQQAPGVRLHCPARVVQVERHPDSADVFLENGEKLSGQLLVAADGSHSSLAQLCGVQWEKKQYQQTAIIANVATSEPHRGRAFERFTPQGPLAFLPMSAGRSTIVWCHHQDQQPLIDSWDDQQFIQQLQAAFGWRLGQLLKTGRRHSYPLQLMMAERVVSHRLVLVGNAAQTLHPIAGQGFNLGLRDVMMLANYLQRAVMEQNDIGAYSLLSDYQQSRQQDRQTTINLTDGLVSLFANNCAPLVVGRGVGLMMMEQCAVLRNQFAYQTLGWVEDR